jgi:hypothetical protein
MTNERFYPAKEKKNHFEVEVEYIQLGITKHTHRKSVCGGKKMIGMKAWDVENPEYRTEEEWNKMICRNKAQRLKMITITEMIWE